MHPLTALIVPARVDRITLHRRFQPVPWPTSPTSSATQTVRSNALARIGNFIGAANALDEKGQPVPGSEHDILTGSTLDGCAYTDNTRDFTCSNWTSAADGAVAAGVVPDPIPPGVPSARLGHSDKGNIVPSWNSSHPSRGCSQASLVATGGGGWLYCFATN
jgi:hypothetical protein